MSKILCVCKGGDVRSVAMAYFLKHGKNEDAIAASYQFNSPETLKLLMDWADIIMVAEDYMRNRLPIGNASKVKSIDIGPDIWGNPFHPDLRNLIEERLKCQ